MARTNVRDDRLRAALVAANPDTVLLERTLANLIAERSVTLLLGAGISKPFGLPTWRALVSRLYVQQGKRLPKGVTTDHAATAFYVDRCDSDMRRLKRAVRKALYANSAPSDAKLATSSLLSPLHHLLSVNRHKGPINVITLNYDDYLERACRQHHSAVQSLSSPSEAIDPDAEILVWHPHGLLPSLDTEGESQRIVLERGSFLTLIGNDSDPWRQKLLAQLRTGYVWMIGVSGDDPNFESILFSAYNTPERRDRQTESFALLTDKKPARATAAAQIRRTALKRAGISLLQVRSYETGLPACLKRVANRARRL